MSDQTPTPDPQQQPAAQPLDPAQQQPPAQQPPAGEQPDQAAQFAKLQEQLAALQSKVDEQQALPLVQGAPPQLTVPEPPSSLPDFAQDWPVLGGLKLDDGDPAPQPWDLRAHGLSVGSGANGETTIVAPHSGKSTVIEPGAPDHVSPIVVGHSQPILGPLSSTPAVAELGRLLALVGIDNSVSQGRNPNLVYDESMQNAVGRFREAYKVQEDPSQWPIDGENQAKLHCGPWTWEAIYRAAAKIQAEQEADGRQLDHAGV